MDDKVHCILCKNHDPTCANSLFTQYFLPVFHTLPTSLDSLTAYLNTVAEYDKLVILITSKRAVESLSLVFKLLDQSVIEKLKNSSSYLVVGPSTQISLHTLCEIPLNRISGSSSGNASNLVQEFILPKYKPDKCDVLFLCGDKKRPEIPNLLRYNGFQKCFTEIQVYETFPKEGIAVGYKKLIDRISESGGEDLKDVWIVFYSPSGVDILDPIIRSVGLPGNINLKFASIGKSTSERVCVKEFLRVDAQAVKPTPESLFEAVKNYYYSFWFFFDPVLNGLSSKNRVGSKPGSGGVASASQANIDRRERLKNLALETIDLNKDPYFMKNHLGSYECKLCLTLHSNEGSYLAHTQGKKHQNNIAMRAARDNRNDPNYIMATQNQITKVPVVPKKSIIKIGRPGYKVTKIRDPITQQLGLLFIIIYPEITPQTIPRHRFMSAFEQRKEPPNKEYQYILFAAEPYETIAFKIQSREVDKREGRFWSHWDVDSRKFHLQFFFK